MCCSLDCDLFLPHHFDVIYDIQDKSTDTMQMANLFIKKTKGNSLVSLWNLFSFILVFTKSVNSNFRAFCLAPVTRNILGYSLFATAAKMASRFETFSKHEI